MKFGIITHYHISNHGAILQLQALIKVLASQGIEAKALRFDKLFDFVDEDLTKKYRISFQSVPFYLKFFIKNGLGKTLFNLRKVRKFNRYKKEAGIVGDYYSHVEKMDGVIVGSDEIFALHTGPNPVYWGHGCPSKHVFAYAASFGPTTIDDVRKKNCVELVKSGLKMMNGVSVRDNNSWEIVRQLTGKEPSIVCDPVILYGYQKEISQFEVLHCRPYVLVYAYDYNMNDEHEVDMIRTFAKKHHLQTLSVGFYHSWCDRIVNPGPMDILQYFKCADFVVTDTFHGSVMSIVAKKNFAVITRNNKNKLVNLLDEYGLLKRIIDKDNLESLYQSRIDYSVVDVELEKRRKESMNYLLRMIEKCKEL